MKSGLETIIADQLEGLLVPPEEIEWSWISLFGVGFIVILTIFIISHWLSAKNTPLRVARKKLDRLENAITPTSDRHSVALQLAGILREGLEVTRLDVYQPARLSKWRAFQSDLNSACYATDINDNDSIKKLLDETRLWLQG